MKLEKDIFIVGEDAGDGSVNVHAFDTDELASFYEIHVLEEASVTEGVRTISQTKSSVGVLMDLINMEAEEDVIQDFITLFNVSKPEMREHAEYDFYIMCGDEIFLFHGGLERWNGELEDLTLTWYNES